MKSAPEAHGTPGRRPRTLGRRELNRALLSRQLLLDPAAGLEPLDAIDHLVGLQAQATLPPYLGLRARLAKFEAPMLATLLSDRRAVRLTLLRGTVHLVSAADARRLRPLLQPVIERGFNGTFGRRMRQVDLATLRAAVVELLAVKPLSGRELGRRLAAAGLESDEEALGSAARVHVPLVQVPPRGILGAGGQARYQTLASWLDPPSGQAPVPAALLDELVLRYLAAFGPASAQDVQSWSGLTRLAEVLERLSPGLERFRDEQGRVLFDLPDAPRPDPDTPAPVRFLGEFDNLFLAHVDRSRICAEAEVLFPRSSAGRALNHLLVDGMMRAGWWIEREPRARATLVVCPRERLSRTARAEIAAEAEELLGFVAVDATSHGLRFEP